MPNPVRSRSRTGDAPATKFIIAVTAIMFLVTQMGSPSNEIFQALAQYTPAIDAGQWWRIFTPVLLHAGLMHILFNMWALWVLGPQIERGVGTPAFVALYLASAGMGGVVAYYLGGPNDVAVGASGAIFGLFGIWISWALHRRNTAWGRSMLGQLGFLLLINAAIPFIFPGVSWQAHLGGLVTGFLIGEVWSRIRGSNAAQLRTAFAGSVAVLAAVLVLI
jgi:membrane associated rhomboid family serine protease